MTHEPNTEQLALYARDRLEPALKETITAHLSTGCQACERQLTWVQSILDAINADPAEELPEALKTAANRIFADHNRGRAERNRSILHAILTFDSAWIPVPVGVRAPAFGQRRLLFHAGPFEIDLEVTRMRRGAFDLLGQVMPVECIPASSEVTVRQRGTRASSVDERGFFSFHSVEPGVVGLTFKLGRRTVKLSQVRIE
jgi:hypothetical protein